MALFTTSVLFVLFDSAAAHGYMTLPVGRQPGAPNMHTLSMDYSNKAQSWFTYNTPIPNSPSLCDYRLRTVFNARDSGITCPYPYARDQPWFDPGAAPILDPCGTYDNQGGGTQPGTSLPAKTPRPQWLRGSTAKVAWAATANHGGGYAYRLCPTSRTPTEECFNDHHLTFAAQDTEVVWADSDGRQPVSIPTRRINWNSTSSTWTLSASGEGLWTRNPVPLSNGWFEPEGAVAGLPRDNWGYSLRDAVEIPSNLPLGNYVLAWRWDAEGQGNVWMNCADVEIVDGQFPPSPTPTPPSPAPVPAPSPVPVPTPATGKYYTLIYDGGNCCRGTGGELPKGDVNDGEADDPEQCHADCNNNSNCKWFSHSMEYKNCMLCSKCEITTEGNSAKYTSWEQVSSQQPSPVPVPTPQPTTPVPTPQPTTPRRRSRRRAPEPRCCKWDSSCGGSCASGWCSNDQGSCTGCGGYWCAGSSASSLRAQFRQRSGSKRERKASLKAATEYE